MQTAAHEETKPTQDWRASVGDAMDTPVTALSDVLESTRRCCEAALRRDDLSRMADVMATTGVRRADAVRIVGSVTETPSTLAALSQMKTALARQGVVDERASLERLLLVYAALDALPKLPALPVGEDVKRLFCEEFRFFASEPDAVVPFEAGTARFTGMCKTATLRRFCAGQFDWEISTVRRLYVLQVPPTQLPSVIAFIGLRMRGLGPVFFSHLAPRRKNRSLQEDEANRSYYRMAKAMERQPHIKGFAACSWFRSPGTHRVSPHLSWLSRVFEENGGLVVESGYEDPECGVLSRSVTRRRLYESGEFRPRRGLVLWPREAMIAWAASHPAFEDCCDVPP